MKKKVMDMQEINLSKGNLYEDFEPGQVFNHHWGRTLTECDNVIFCSETMQYNPMYFNVEYARSLGYREIPVHPLFVMNVAGGMSVEDLSEGQGKGGIFLGIDKVRFYRPSYPGDTITSASEVIERRLREDKPGWGDVTWRIRAYDQNGELVMEFDKTNMVACDGENAIVEPGVQI